MDSDTLASSSCFIPPVCLFVVLKVLLRIEIVATHPEGMANDTQTHPATEPFAHNGDTKTQVVQNGYSNKTTGSPINGGNKDYVVPISSEEVKEVKVGLEPTHHASLQPPFRLKGVLKTFKSFDVTPTIGKEFPEAKLDEWLKAPNSDELIRDLAITSKLIY